MPEDLRLKHATHIRIEGADITDVVFSHEHPDIQSVNITRLLKAIAEGKVYSRTDTFTFSKQSLDQAARERDIDPKVVEYLITHPDKQNEPVLGVLMSNDDVLVIDGSHRSAVWASRGIYDFKICLIHYSALPEFRVRTFVNGKEEILDGDTIRKGYEFNR